MVKVQLSQPEVLWPTVGWGRVLCGLPYSGMEDTLGTHSGQAPHLNCCLDLLNFVTCVHVPQMKAFTSWFLEPL